MFRCALNQRSNPSFDNILVLLGSITERFKERPESTPNTPLDRNLLNFHKRVHKAIESTGMIRQSIEVVSEELNLEAVSIVKRTVRSSKSMGWSDSRLEMWLRVLLMYFSKSPRSDVLSLAKNGRVVTRCYGMIRNIRRKG